MPDLEQRRRPKHSAPCTTGRVLLLPNVWDVASARIVEEAGFPAHCHNQCRHCVCAGISRRPEDSMPIKCSASRANRRQRSAYRSPPMSKLAMGRDRKMRVSNGAQCDRCRRSGNEFRGCDRRPRTSAGRSVFAIGEEFAPSARPLRKFGRAARAQCAHRCLSFAGGRAGQAL